MNLANSRHAEASRRPSPSVHTGPLDTTVLLQAIGAGEGGRGALQNERSVLCIVLKVPTTQFPTFSKERNVVL